MARCVLVAELASSHGGNVALAEDMIKAAADAGADLVKAQTYSLARLRRSDPQYDWLVQSALDKSAHCKLMDVAARCGIEFFSTPFCADSLAMLRELGLRRFKVASSESGNTWWNAGYTENWIISWPWGHKGDAFTAASYTRGNLTTFNAECFTHLAAIPLYPTPLEAVGRAALLDGWSCHCVGLAACQRAIALGAKMLEVHFTLPDTAARQKPWDKTPADIRALRQFAEDCETMHSGVNETFRTRWTA